jgi:RsiW-degrading membrane proteinase PrsW (M82 family)
LRARDEYAGKQAKCPVCSNVLTVPLPDPDVIPLADGPPLMATAAGTPAITARSAALDALPVPVRSERPKARRLVAKSVAAPQKHPRDYLYWVLALALLPLVMSLLPHEHDQPFRDRLRRALGVDSKKQVAPTGQPTKGQDDDDDMDDMASGIVSVDEALESLPGDRLPGAHLARRSVMHWGYAAVSASVFLVIILCIFPTGSANPIHLLLAGCFTATLGIVLLLVVQLLAAVAHALPVGGRGLLSGLIYLLKFIGFSYQAALDPHSNFLKSFLGFTCGVGLCEEFCKALPLIFSQRHFPHLAWRGACLWGMATGAGFGVSEGISYSSQFYNGIASGDVYLMRFASCVALHVVWSASLAIGLYNHWDRIASAQDSGQFWLQVVQVAGPPIVFHGLYDTLLKMDLKWAALAVALASFGWLAWLVEKARAREEAPPALVDDGTDSADNAWR